MSRKETTAANEAHAYGQRMVAHVNPILPEDAISTSSLLAVVAIMSFLAALAIGAVAIVHGAAKEWRTDVVREATIQLRPVSGRDLEADLRKAAEIAKATGGVSGARIFSKDETNRLLEPWLGTGADLSALPVPRLVQVTIEPGSTPDLDGLRRMLASGLPNATLDDHRGFSAKLAAISDAVTLTGLAILALVLAATALSVSFATRGAVAANRNIVEVLHFVGARDSFVARIFARHFLAVGLKGGLIGGAVAAALFALVRLLAGMSGALPDGSAAYFFAHFAPNAWGFLWIAAVAAGTALITVLSSRFTVHRTLRTID